MNPKTLHKIPYGLYVICSRNRDNINGQIANALFQVTSQPETLAVSINKQNLTHEFIDTSKVFTASILCKNTPMPFIGTFGWKSGRDIDKFQNVKYELGKTKAPIVLDNSLAFIEVNVINKIDVGTHCIFIGKVVNAEILTDESAMTYEYYHKVKGGISPKTAPTYSSDIDKVSTKEKGKMEKYVCSVCGYIYDPEKGDPVGGIAPRTRFEDLPDDWCCPVCGAKKDSFEKV